jgi:hypothetical protein
MSGAKQQKARTATPKPPLLVFGLDDSGKPKGARFLGEQIDQAREASTSMNLELHEALTDAQQELARKLPSGRIYAKGRAFVPFIKRDLFDKLAKATSSAISSSGPAGASTSPSGSPQPPVIGLPKSWAAIGPGHLVLTNETAREGWWEAITVSREGDILTLRYRDFPRLPPFERHVSVVALINPGPF